MLSDCHAVKSKVICGCYFRPPILGSDSRAFANPALSWMAFSDFLLPAFTWHGFGRNSCVLHTALLLLSAVPPKEFCAHRAPKIKNSFGPPQNAVAWFGSSRHSLFSRPSEGQKEGSSSEF